MTLTIGKAFAAVCTLSLFCTIGASVQAQSAAADTGSKPSTKSHSHSTPAKHLTKDTIHQNGPQAQATPSGPPQYYPWGAPPRQDPRDAYQGYFANPVDNPRYYSTGRATLIFRQ